MHPRPNGIDWKGLKKNSIGVNVLYFCYKHNCYTTEEHKALNVKVQARKDNLNIGSQVFKLNNLQQNKFNSEVSLFFQAFNFILLRQYYEHKY